VANTNKLMNQRWEKSKLNESGKCIVGSVVHKGRPKEWGGVPSGEDQGHSNWWM